MRKARDASSASSASAASHAASTAASVASAAPAAAASAASAGSSSSGSGGCVRVSAGRYELSVDRVKLGHSAAVALASHRFAAPTAAESMAQRRAALVVPHSALHAMAMHAGQAVWITDRQQRWYAWAQIWPADKVMKAGCRLLLPSHASSPFVDGSFLQLQPFVQSVTRVTALRVRPLSASTSHLLAGETHGSEKMQQLLGSVLSAVIADRYTFVGDEISVTLFDQRYSFAVSAIEPTLGPAAPSSDGATTSVALAGAPQTPQRSQPDAKLSAMMEQMKIGSPATPARGTVSPAPAAEPLPVPALYSADSHTRVLISSAASPTATTDSSAVPTDVIAADAIGGLETEIAALRELITLPLLQPHLFTSFGLKPPKGVLLFGPPGTGKTMLARAVAQQTFSSFYLVNGPEIISKFVGESEEKLASIFALARKHAPSIIFLDELDSLCPKRDESSDEMQKRIVASLLTLMDGLSSSASGAASAVDDRVLVIGATNRPDALDTALRRAGRFDREMEIGIPNESKRRDILTRMLKNMPHDLSEQQLSYIASVTHGFVGADLKALVRESALVALARWQQTEPDWMQHLLDTQEAPPVAGSASSHSSTASLSTPPPRLPTLHLTSPDVLSALAGVKPSALRSLVIDVPKVSWADIGGQEDVKMKLKEAVDWPLMHPEAFLRLGIQPPKGILLYGPPGCSKTLMAKALASESSRNFIAVKGPELFSKWVGESEKAVKEIFRKARASAPSIVFFDEIDSISAARSEGGGGGGGGGGGEGGERVAHRVLSQLLTELDGIEPLRQVTVLAATNRPDLIDAALLRPGRIDRILYVSPPDAPSCAEIFAIEFRRIGAAASGLLPVPPSLSARAFELGLSGAEIAAVVREAALVAMEDDLDARVLTELHFERAMDRTVPRITKEMRDFYAGYAARSAVASV